MSPLVNMYVPMSQEKPLNRSVKTPSHLKWQRSIAWHNYKEKEFKKYRISQRNGKVQRRWSSFKIL